MRKRTVLAADAAGKEPWTGRPLRVVTALGLASLAAALVAGSVLVLEIPGIRNLKARLAEQTFALGTVTIGLDQVLLALPFLLLAVGGMGLGYLRWGWRVQRLALTQWNGLIEANRSMTNAMSTAAVREETMERERSALAQQVDRLAGDLENNKQDLAVSLNRLTEINVEFDTYRRQNAVEAFDLQTMRSDLSEANDRMTSLHAEVAATDDVVSGLRNQIDIRDDELAETQRRLADKEAMVFQLETEITSAREELFVIRAQVDDGNAKIKILETQLDISVSDRTDLMKQTGQVEALEGEVGTAIRQAEETAAQLILANEKINHLEARLTEATATTERLHTELAEKAGELRAIQDQTNGMERDLASLRSAKQHQENDADVARQRIGDLETQLQDLLLATSRRDGLEADLAQAQRQLETAEQGLSQSRNRSGQLEGELMAAEARAASLREQLAVALRQNAELSVLQTQLQGTKSRVEGLQSQLVTAVERGAQLQYQLAGSEARIDRLETSLAASPPSGASPGATPESPTTIDLRENPSITDSSSDGLADVLDLPTRSGSIL